LFVTLAHLARGFFQKGGAIGQKYRNNLLLQMKIIVTEQLDNLSNPALKGSIDLF